MSYQDKYFIGKIGDIKRYLSIEEGVYGCLIRESHYHH